VLNGGGGNQRNAFKRIDKQPCVDKLVCKERPVLVIEERATLPFTS
jgi:hypothetical protein